MNVFKFICKKMGNLIIGVPSSIIFAALVLLIGAAVICLGAAVVTAIAVFAAVVILALPILSFFGLSDNIKKKVNDLENKASIADNVTEFKR